MTVCCYSAGRRYQRMHETSIFAPPKLTAKGQKRQEEIVETFHDALTKLEEICPVGPELNIVKTKLQEAAYFATKSLVNVPENWEGSGQRRVA
jgi:hypothetical protein